MTADQSDCEHRCRNTCAMLTRVLRDERSAIESCNQMLRDCEDPAMIAFAKDIVKTHSSTAAQIESALNEIKARAGILDDMIEGLEKQ